jgi:hypothetical protein
LATARYAPAREIFPARFRCTMKRRSILLATLFCLAPNLALADMAPPTMASVAIAVSGVETTALTYRLTNTGPVDVSLAAPRLVLLERGVRVPVRITEVRVDGALVAASAPFRIGAGRTVTLRLAHEALAPGGEVELSFRGGGDPVEPFRAARTGRS